MHFFLITTSKGLESLLADEIRALLPHSECRESPGQVRFEGELSDAYRVCLWSRLANRVLLELASGKCETAEALYALAASVDWPSQFGVSRTFAIDFVGTNRVFRNSQFAALKIKDAVVDRFQQVLSRRPNVDKQRPDIRIQGRLKREQAMIYLDLTGRSLHIRHYRQKSGVAPLKEHLAFAMLMRSGWTKTPERPLCDPMCGAGTIAIEAALYAQNIAPALERHFWGFQAWSGHDKVLWSEIHAEAQGADPIARAVIYASDSSDNMVDMARDNAEAAGVELMIQFQSARAEELVLSEVEPGFIVSNPPYGERLEEIPTLLPLFKALGQHFKQHFAGWQLSMLTSQRDLFKAMKLRASKDYKFMNGNLPCNLVNYALEGDNLETLESVERDSDFANRLRKNRQRLSGWLKHNDIDCYRLYDADLPDYNAAIDVYGEWVVLQEYAPPKTIPEDKARARLQQMIMDIPQVLGVLPSRVSVKTRQQQKGSDQYQKLAKRNESIEVNEYGAKFWVNLHDYLDTGLFLDHRSTRQQIKALSNNKRVLNLFAYTGSVSVQAALGGASQVTTVDMSKTYIDWAKKNFSLNGIKGYHRFFQDNVLTWLETHSEPYDIIFVDPPTFSNSKRMENSWDVQRDHLHLLSLVQKCMGPGAVVFFSTNLRSFKLDQTGLDALGLDASNISAETLPEDYKRNPKIHQCWKITRRG